MPSIIKEFYYGNVRPTNLNLIDKPAYKYTMELLGKNNDKLLEMLSAPEQEQFEKHLCVQEEIIDMERYEAFRYALRFGILLMAEVFSGLDEIAGYKEEV